MKASWSFYLRTLFRIKKKMMKPFAKLMSQISFSMKSKVYNLHLQFSFAVYLHQTYV